MSNGKGAIRPAAYDQGYRLGYMKGCAEGDRRTIERHDSDMINLRKELHAQNERIENLRFAAEQDKMIRKSQAVIIREQREQLRKIGALCKS